MNDLSENRLSELARCFVQRTRRDIEHDWESESCFPQRIPEDRTYRLSPAYRELFLKTYAFCAEIVHTGQSLQARQRRVRYWGALALLRCVMSSPAAALAALETRHGRLEEAVGADEVDFRGFVFESDNDRTDDEQPTPPIEEAEASLPDAERRRLRGLGKLADALLAPGQDTKLEGLVQTVQGLLAEGYHPIVWCRYVATAEYVAKALAQRLAAAHPALQVVCITGRQGDEERRARIAEIDAARPRVLVATDCLSEGINLQEKFTAAVHYDLPWNPNRLEQREGRVDRYGQPARQVKVIRYYGADNPVDGVVLDVHNPVDGVVLDVLLNKAREIHKALGTHVPVPEESESVTEAVLNALFLRGYGRTADQLAFDFMPAEVGALHRRWERDAEREKITRTRFAQRALKPDEVRRELEAADAVLGDPQAVRVFVQEAAQRLGLTLTRAKNSPVYHLATSPLPPTLPDAVRFAPGDLPSAAHLAGRRALCPAGAQGWPVAHRLHLAHAGGRGIPGTQPPLRSGAGALSAGRGPHPRRRGARGARRRHRHPRRDPAHRPAVAARALPRSCSQPAAALRRGGARPGLHGRCVGAGVAGGRGGPAPAGGSAARRQPGAGEEESAGRRRARGLPRAGAALAFIPRGPRPRPGRRPQAHPPGRAPARTGVDRRAAVAAGRVGTAGVAAGRRCGMNAHPAVRIEGGLLGPDTLEQLLAAQLPGQRPADFGLSPRRTLTEEIAAVFSDARALWQVFRRRLERLPEGVSATSETRELWMVPFLRLLDYELRNSSRAREVDGLTFAVSHYAGEEDQAPPVHLVGYRQELGRLAPRSRPRLSPHALVQEYLNRSEALWGLVSNGRTLRLLRDSTFVRRQAYVEFDLEAILEEERFADFVLLYRLLHRTRLPQKERAEECLLEQYYQQSIEQGGRVREHLREGVGPGARAPARGRGTGHRNPGERLPGAPRQRRPAGLGAAGGRTGFLPATAAPDLPPPLPAGG